MGTRIHIPLDEDIYNSTIDNHILFRAKLDELIETYPEIFPANIDKGYIFNGWSKQGTKQNVKRRIIQLIQGRKDYLIHPCFVMPYLRGKTIEISKGLRLRKYNLPYHEIAEVHGGNAMFWYRSELSLSQYNIVGTTAKSPRVLPSHLVADEHHDKLHREKVYVCTTVGGDCFFGAHVSPNVSYEALRQAYGIYKLETQLAYPDYTPTTINIDGFASTRKSITHLFPNTTLILCFLHGFLKIETAATKRYDELFCIISQKVWQCYEAKDKFSFAQNIRRLEEWTLAFVPQGNFRHTILKLCQKKRVHQIL